MILCKTFSHWKQSQFGWRKTVVTWWKTYKSLFVIWCCQSGAWFPAPHLIKTRFSAHRMIVRASLSVITKNKFSITKFQAFLCLIKKMLTDKTAKIWDFIFQMDWPHDKINVQFMGKKARNNLLFRYNLWLSQEKLVYCNPIVKVF